MLERPISKAGWTRVAFGDVVRKVNDKVDPWDSGLERYVAGEHMDTDDLRIRRWGLIGDDYLGPAFHMRFKPGHVLYGSRRTYLRKVALADFEGITANTTFVLETKDPTRLMSDLLPFLMQTEAFHSYSIKHSKGSVNPYINFSDLEAFEFELPPIQEQARLVDAFGAAELNADAHRQVRVQLASVLESTISAFVGKWNEKHDFGKLIEDTSYGTSKKSNSEGKGTPVLGIPNVLRDELYLDEFNTVELTKSELKKLALEDGDILMVRTNGNPLYVGRSVLVEKLAGEFAFASYLIRIRVDRRKITPAYAACVFGSSQTRQALRRLAKSSAGNFNLNSKDIRTIKLPVPSIEEQNQLVSQVSKLRRTAKEADTRLEAAFALKRRLLEGISS